MNNKICPNCGNQNNNLNFCTNCGCKLGDVIVEQDVLEKQAAIQQPVTPVADPEQDKKDLEIGNKLAIISLVLAYGAGMLELIVALIVPKEVSGLFTSLLSLCPLAGLVTMVVGRVKYPKNTFLKVVMWIFIINIILAIIAGIVITIIFIVACASCANNLN